MKELILKKLPKSPISEAYRGIRTNLEFANIDKNFKTILCTSATAGEGKTTTLCNVAAAMADNGNKVLILDCDLRKPRIHKFFELSNAAGLTDILLKGQDYKKFVHKIDYNNISVITAGNIPKNPSELLSSEKMKKFIEMLKDDYDYVMIDAPPVVPVTDSVIMSTYIDGVILVCASGDLNIEMAKKTRESLTKVGANILGVVLNKVPVDSKKYAYYYYYHQNDGKGDK
ncbi:CpsD/CapB family tyrosine-protein kinase [Proteocatella sphenisci]|uniref:CpsD/CapB family tyrosine-protein kinase n=1 Tax=Proteocatella sphenisci TaxID=181070 RepID=UPI00048EF798|nr:CpsD/CapB family tyrosine-protein kinase [Proteocatella sphenisci]